MAGVRKRLISQDVSVTSHPDEPITSNEEILQILEEVQQEVTCSRLLQLDINMTKILCLREQLLGEWTDSPVYLTLLIHCILCEVAGSLLFLLPLTLLLTLSSPNLSHFTFYTNLFQAQILDSIVRILVKAGVRREQEEPLSSQFPGISHYSFPSGHTSRAAMLAFFILSTSSRSSLFTVFVIMSVVTVSVSRVVLGRHYVSDVLGGVVVGVANGTLISAFLWTEENELVDFFAAKTGVINWCTNALSGVL